MLGGSAPNSSVNGPLTTGDLCIRSLNQSPRPSNPVNTGPAGLNHLRSALVSYWLPGRFGSSSHQITRRYTRLLVTGTAHADVNASLHLWNQCSGNLAIRLASDLLPVVRLLTGWWQSRIVPGTRMNKPTLVNSAPQRRRSPVEGESIHVDVDEHGSYRAAWSGNWLGRSLGTNVRYRRASNLAGRNVSEA
jgi:hypothetical protein